MLGNPILVSIFTLAFRKHVFEKRFQDIIQADRERSMKPTGAVVGMAGAMFGLPVMSNFRSFNKAEPPKPSSSSHHQHVRSPPVLGGVGAHLQVATSPEIRISMTRDSGEAGGGGGGSPFLAPPPPRTAGGGAKTPEPPVSPGSRSITFLEPIREGSPRVGPTTTTGLGVQSHHASPSPSPSSPQENRAAVAAAQPWGQGEQGLHQQQQGFNINSFLRQNKAQIGRNGQFFNLTAQEREYLGGVEYRALKLLILAVTSYFVVLQVLGALTLGAWIAGHETPTADAQNPWWTGVFLAVSAFNNGGVCLLDAGIQAFLSSYFLLVVVTCLMLAGSAAFPAFLRLGLWLLAQALEYGTREDDYPVLKETLSFTLKYPRRVYTMLFPSRSTWYMVAMLAGFVVVDWVFILTLSLGNTVLTSMPVGQRVFDTLFQSISIWSGGFAALSPASVYVDLQVLWLFIMYLETYPQAITMRASNVYEERSLGIYAGDEPAEYGGTEGAAEKGSLPPGSYPMSTLLSVPPRAHADNQSPLSPVSAVSQASQVSIRRLADVGRRGTAFVGRQIQQRMGGFQGVGVSAPRRPEQSGRPFLTAKSSTNVLAGVSPSLSQTSSTSSAATYRSVTTKREPQVDLVSHQVRSQLSHDVWWMALALFVITLVETKHTIMDPSTFSAFSILFEVVSAYTNIGLSIGLPDAAYSLSGGFYTGSKMVLVLVMLRGRHRGLPVALDRAVRLPKEKLDDMEEEDAEIRRAISHDASMRSRAVSRKTSVVDLPMAVS